MPIYEYNYKYVISVMVVENENNSEPYFSLNDQSGEASLRKNLS